MEILLPTCTIYAVLQFKRKTIPTICSTVEEDNSHFRNNQREVISKKSNVFTIKKMKTFFCFQVNVALK